MATNQISSDFKSTPIRFSKPLTKVVQLPTNQRIAEGLKCVGCGRLPLPPAFLCLNGHPHCKWCSYEARATCNKEISSGELCLAAISSQRLTIYEGLILQSSLPCDFQPAGCKEVLKGTNYHHHIQTCVFRTIQCPVTNCDRKPISNNSSFLTHLKKAHGTPRVKGFCQETEISLDTPTDATRVEYIVSCHKEEFLVLVRSKREELYVWVSLLGPNISKKFTFRAILPNSGPVEQNRKVWHGIIQPFGFVSEDPEKTCFVIHKPALARDLVYKKKDGTKAIWMKVLIHFSEQPPLPAMHIPGWKKATKNEQNGQPKSRLLEYIIPVPQE